jgi:outer membrane protein OmpA-like peptidoglycan-associated protein
MRSNLAIGVLIVVVSLVDMHAVRPAEACGVKLTVKSSTPRKAVARTSNPSDVLLLGNPPRRLELDLTAAGHRVEVAPTAAAAKRKSYAVVVADASQEGDARSNFSRSAVVVRSGDVAADMRSVEAQVARRPVRTAEARPVVAARPGRTPIAAGPSQPARRIVAASEPKEPQPVPDTPPPPERVAASVPKTTEKTTETRPAAPKASETRSAAPKEPRATEPKVAEPKGKTTEPRVTVPKATEPAETTPPASRQRPSQIPQGKVHEEVYFTVGISTLDDQSASPLARTVRWLTDNRDIHVIIEGHADPTGTHEGNMALSQRRAEWVRDYLVSHGIDESRLEVMAYGDTRLRYGRTDRRNRRAVIVAK